MRMFEILDRHLPHRATFLRAVKVGEHGGYTVHKI